MMEGVILFVYFLMLGILSIYGVHRYYLLYLYLKNRKSVRLPVGEFRRLPRVTVQLPFYNEMYVAGRLIDHAVAMDYPRDLLEIQVLDDSTDDTVRIAQERVAYHRERGVNITYIHREERGGYKAGALEAGLQVAGGDYIAIFDADFVPRSDFLRATVHYFTDPNVGMVQARWGHINEKYSLITRVQSIFLDGHFVIEHTARNRSGRFFNFNGTAGIWRKEAIRDAGGWQHDTLTEDLDLSYRAQLRCWNFVYMVQYDTPAELPVDIAAFKSQQHRWTKGSIQTARKLFKEILASPHPLKIKSESFFHLLANFNYLLMIPFSLSLLPVVLLRHRMGLVDWYMIDVPLILLTTVSMSVFYMVSQRELYLDWRSRVKYLPALMALGIGLSINNTTAVLEALFKRESGFVRTPKFGVREKGDNWRKKKYRAHRGYVLASLELLLGVYFTFVSVVALQRGYWYILPFLMLFQFGYLYTAGLSFYSILRR